MELRAFGARLAQLQPPPHYLDLQTVEQMAATYEQCAHDFEQARERGEV